MAFSPTTASVAQLGDIVVLQVSLDADGVTFNAVGFLINFDQTLLQVVDAAGDPASQVEPGNLPGTTVMNTASNTQGTIEFAQGILPPAPAQTGGTFTVATIRLKVIAKLPEGGTQVTFVDGGGNTGVFGGPTGGQQFLCELPGPATITGWFTLTVNKVGGGSGTVVSDPAGINCGADCAEDYVEGTLVTLTAHPGVHSYFVGWSEGCSGTGLTTTVTIDTDRSCTATFGYPVGGIVVPVGKLELVALRLVSEATSGQTLWMGVVGLMVGVVSVVVVRRRRGA